MSLKEAGIVVNPDENGKTFEENSLIKAKACAELTDKVVIADDSGLIVDSLPDILGVKTARFLGEETPYPQKWAEVIRLLEGKERTARFVCAIAAVDMEGNETVVRETMEGYIGYKEAGENGFGYDPIFMLPEYGCTSAEISMEEKNKISHRGKALMKMRKLLEV
jgi:XTP/dITP diphosphohydrolase